MSLHLEDQLRRECHSTILRKVVDLSIIIVNYNVKYFLAQCLNSILNSDIENIKYEVIVVDNASTDDSFPFLEKSFNYPFIQFIKEDVNLGFAKACNRGFNVSKGEIILFLNPDTLLSKDTLIKSYNRLKGEDKIGALGVKMVDGKGNFLPESKRSFPTPINSLIKLTGLKRWGPKWIKPYNLDHLNEDHEHYVEVLCGAFFMVKKNVLMISGGFDEDFFMYGEDIDLSKRIGELGYKLLYYPGASILHYKGESHGVKNLKYFSRFYNAMTIYAEKHYSKYVSTLLKFTIVFAGLMAVLKNLLSKYITMLIDGILIGSIFILIKYLWAYFYFNDINYYPSEINLIIVLYVFILLISLFISEHYKQFASLRNTLSAWFAFILALLVFHALAPESLRFSRMLLVVFSGISLPIIIITRLIYTSLNWIKGSYLFLQKKSEAIVVSKSNSFSEIKSILHASIKNVKVLGYIEHEELPIEKNLRLGSLLQLEELIRVYRPNHIIFNLDEFSSDDLFITLKRFGKDLKIYGYSKKSLGIIGSSSATEAGEIFTRQFTYKLDLSSSRILKRMFDLIIAGMVVVLSPVLFLLKRKLVLDAFSVIQGKNTLVGYNLPDDKSSQLPRLSPGVVTVGNEKDSMETRHYKNLSYARNYSLFTDIEMLFRYIWETK